MSPNQHPQQFHIGGRIFDVTDFNPTGKTGTFRALGMHANSTSANSGHLQPGNLFVDVMVTTAVGDYMDIEYKVSR